MIVNCLRTEQKNQCKNKCKNKTIKDTFIIYAYFHDVSKTFNEMIWMIEYEIFFKNFANHGDSISI